MVKLVQACAKTIGKTPKNTRKTALKHRQTALKHRQTALKHRHKPTKKLAYVKKKSYLCISKEQIITIIKDGGTDEPNTQIMARTSKREMLARAEQNAREMEKALKPKKATRTKKIQPSTKATENTQSKYMLYTNTFGKLEPAFQKYLTTNSEAIDWALTYLKKVKSTFRTMTRAELRLITATGGEIKVQGFYRA